MTSTPLSFSRFTALAVPTLLWAGAAMAQAPDQRSSPNSSKLQQPTSSSVQQQESPQADADKNGTEIDRKIRELDRRLNRIMRSVCSGC